MPKRERSPDDDDAGCRSGLVGARGCGRSSVCVRLLWHPREESARAGQTKKSCPGEIEVGNQGPSRRSGASQTGPLLPRPLPRLFRTIQHRPLAARRMAHEQSLPLRWGLAVPKSKMQAPRSSIYHRLPCVSKPSSRSLAMLAPTEWMGWAISTAARSVSVDMVEGVEH